MAFKVLSKIVHVVDKSSYSVDRLIMFFFGFQQRNKEFKCFVLKDPAADKLPLLINLILISCIHQNLHNQTHLLAMLCHGFH